ncbi:MAG: hemolysin family protein [Candidatus Nanopelagicales bacterium]|nr:hemolysin family protein [Candidatus Nanopelagicales bacterium]MDZ4248828.1 hemolysin family protein [Candidatus Nanopelagicales bacterium]
MSDVLGDIAVVMVFVLVGGFFAMSEMALVSLREGQIPRLAEKDPRRGARLQRLVHDPNRFLAAVQVGVTMAGFLSAGFGASQISPAISPVLENLGMADTVARTVAFVAVTILIVYLSMVLGELVPKRIALQNAERVALRVAGAIDWVARIARPFIWLVSVSTDGLVRLAGGDPKASKALITEEELRGLVAAHTDLTDQERELIDDVFAAGDRELREVMVPRTEATFLPETTLIGEAAKMAARMPHSRYPIIRGSADDIVGFIHVRDLLDPALTTQSKRIGGLVREVMRFPSSKRVIPALNEMRTAGHHMAIVVDEYGGTDGIVTLEDLVEELVGEIHDEYDEAAYSAPSQAGGARQFDGLMNLDEFEEASGIELLEGPFETLAGFLVARLGHVPQVGDSVQELGHKFTVESLDGRRVDLVLVEPVESDDLEGPEPDPGGGSAEWPS